MKTILSIILIELLCARATLAMDSQAPENTEPSVSSQQFIASVEQLNWAVIKFLASFRSDRHAENNQQMAIVKDKMKESVALQALLSAKDLEEHKIWCQALESTIKMLGLKFQLPSVNH